MRRRLREIARASSTLGLEDGAHDPAPGGSHHQPQAHPAPVAGRGAAPAGAVQAQADPAAGRRAAAASRAAEPRVGHRLPVRRDRRPPEAEAVQHRRRAHPRGAGHATSAGPAPPMTSSPSSNASSPSAARPSICGWTTVPSSSPGRCATGAGSHDTTTTYIEPGSPWENPFVESFNGRVRDELLNIEEFGTLLEAQVVIEAWRDRVQHLPTPLVPRRPHPRRVRRAMDHQPTSTPMTAGPLNGAPSLPSRIRISSRLGTAVPGRLRGAAVAAAIQSYRPALTRQVASMRSSATGRRHRKPLRRRADLRRRGARLDRLWCRSRSARNCCHPSTDSVPSVRTPQVWKPPALTAFHGAVPICTGEKRLPSPPSPICPAWLEP